MLTLRVDATARPWSVAWERPTPRAFTLGVLAVATINVVIAAGVLPTLARYAWATDIQRNLSVAADLVAGQFGNNRGYVYTPLAALATVPATWLPAAAAIMAWLILRLGLLLEGVRRETAGWRRIDRVAAFAAVATFIPTLYDLLLGNVSIVIAAGVAIVAWSKDRVAAGVALGLILATVPKPSIIPILAWMLLYRRRAFVGAVATAAMATVVAAVWLGVGPYRDYLSVLSHPEYLDSPQYGNLSISTMPLPLAIVLGVLTVVAALIALRRSEAAGFVACLAAGLLLAPYTMAYGAVMLLLAVRPLLAVAPLPTFLLSLTGSIMVFISLPLWAIAWIAATLAVPRAAWTKHVPSVAR